MKYIKHSQQSKIKSINQQPLPTTNPFPDIFFDGVFFPFLIWQFSSIFYKKEDKL